MARYSRVALYHKAQNATHNHPKLKQAQFRKEIVQIPEAKQEHDVFHHEEHKESDLTPAVNVGAPVNLEAPEVADSGAEAKRTVKKPTASSKMKRSASASKASAPKMK